MGQPPRRNRARTESVTAYRRAEMVALNASGQSATVRDPLTKWAYQRTPAPTVSRTDPYCEIRPRDRKITDPSRERSLQSLQSEDDLQAPSERL